MLQHIHFRNILVIECDVSQFLLSCRDKINHVSPLVPWLPIIGRECLNELVFCSVHISAQDFRKLEHILPGCLFPCQERLDQIRGNLPYAFSPVNLRDRVDEEIRGPVHQR